MWGRLIITLQCKWLTSKDVVAMAENDLDSCAYSDSNKQANIQKKVRHGYYNQLGQTDQQPNLS